MAPAGWVLAFTASRSCAMRSSETPDDGGPRRSRSPPGLASRGRIRQAHREAADMTQQVTAVPDEVRQHYVGVIDALVRAGRDELAGQCARLAAEQGIWPDP